MREEPDPDDLANERGEIYSPEAEDGRTDWPSEIAKLVWFALAVVAILGLIAYCAPVRAAGFGEGPTKEWFDSLSSPYTQRCCSDADCKRAESDFRDGEWWAKSNKTGTWVQVQTNQLTDQFSVFPQAVLCEGTPQLQASGIVVPNVYCLSIPPYGF